MNLILNFKRIFFFCNFKYKVWNNNKIYKNEK